MIMYTHMCDKVNASAVTVSIGPSHIVHHSQCTRFERQGPFFPEHLQVSQPSQPGLASSQSTGSFMVLLELVEFVTSNGVSLKFLTLAESMKRST